MGTGSPSLVHKLLHIFILYGYCVQLGLPVVKGDAIDTQAW